MGGFTMDKARLEKLGQWAEQDAKEVIFPFWTSDFIVDHENGGFYGKVTLDMQIDNTEPRGLTLTGRMLYAFSTAYRVFGDPIYREKADYTFQDLISRFYDKEYGGAFVTVTAQGEVLEDNKPNYCEAFLLMGCAAYAWATGNEEALRIAKETFEIMESKVKFGPASYHNNMTRDWKPAEGSGFGGRRGPSFPKGAIMFPHHLCQSYVQLYYATGGDEKVKAALKEMAQLVAEKLYDPEKRNIMTIITPDGKRVGSHQSYGHDCEISYLILKVAGIVGDQELLEKLQKIFTDVLYNVLENDFDAYHSLYNGCDLDTGDCGESHVWWAQAEAVTAMLCGYELTGDEKFLDACEKQADYIEKYFVNREHGDWYNNIVVDETGWHIVDGMHGFDKLNGGKCPFHNSQMCFEVMERVKRMTKEEENT